MEKRIGTDDGATIRVRVDDDAVVDLNDERPPIDSDPDDLNEGATEALVLVEPAPNTMTPAGAVAAVGLIARHYAGRRGPLPPPQSWWDDWGKYVAGLLVFLVVITVLQITK